MIRPIKSFLKIIDILSDFKIIVHNLIFFLFISIHFAAEIDLSGTWNFKLDRNDFGLSEKWYQQNLPDKIELPGIVTSQGYGDPPDMNTKWTGNIRDIWFKDPYYKQFQSADNFKMPFWLQPDLHYLGVAWYQKEVEIPPDWNHKRIILFLERSHWETTVWLDNKKISSKNSLATPHEHDLGLGISVGKHRLTIRVDNRKIVDVGSNAHSISDHTQGNWNGMVGKVKLITTDPVWIQEARVFPDIQSKNITIKGALGNLTKKPGRGVLRVQLKCQNSGDIFPVKEQPISWNDGLTNFSVAYKLNHELNYWDEFSPKLYNLDLQFESENYKCQKPIQFGYREVSSRGSRIYLNDRAIFLRGTLECCIFPLTSYPPTDVDSWKRIIRTCKSHGLNHIRFHSWCPPEAAFFAADELGFYFQVECSAWVNQGARLGSGDSIDDWIYQESEEIVRYYGNHPSFLLMAYGNEPGGPNHKEFLTGFLKYWKQKDGRRLYTAAAGWPILSENQYHNSPRPRIQQWGQGLKSRVNARAPETVFDYRDDVMEFPHTPLISHEIGQWCVYPDLDEIKKYTGILKAKNFEIFKEQLGKNNMLHQSRDFLMASGKLQALLYKEEIESALRTPGFGGFQLLDLHDFPGQGTALVGVLDPFWNSKGYISSKEFFRFSGPVVPLVRLPKRIYKAGEILNAEVDLSHFGEEDFTKINPKWILKNNSNEKIAEGYLKSQDVKAGNLVNLGAISIPLRGMSAEKKLNLEITIPGFSVSNDWDIWVYPEKLPVLEENRILVVSDLTKSVIEKLQDGKKVLLLPDPKKIKGDAKGEVALGFSSIFWNSVWTDRQPPHTLGILCDPLHPALQHFPTEYHSNWQWWEIVQNAVPFILTEYPELQPLVQVIDDWVTARKLALVFEVKVGKGKLILSGADLRSQLDSRLVSRQLRFSLLNYMNSTDFDPKFEMSIDQIQKLFD